MHDLLDLVGNTPLVALSRVGAGLPVPIFAKCEHLNPGGSVKDRIAVSMIADAELRGLLRPGDTVIEATAGNTGIGLALVAGRKGYAVVCVMPEKMSLDKRQALAAVGARVVMTPNAPPGHPDNFQEVAKRLAIENGWFLADQFRNPANPAAHEATTGPEIVRQAGGRIGAFVAGVGTGGTITGVGRYLRQACPGARIIVADPVGSPLAGLLTTGIPGLDAAYAVEGIGTSRLPEVLDVSVVHGAESISDAESFATARRLQREEGLLVGGSSGTAVAAALRVAARMDVGDGPVVVLLADSWDRYRTTAWMLGA